MIEPKTIEPEVAPPALKAKDLNLDPSSPDASLFRKKLNETPFTDVKHNKYRDTGTDVKPRHQTENLKSYFREIQQNSQNASCEPPNGRSYFSSAKNPQLTSVQQTDNKIRNLREITHNRTGTSLQISRPKRNLDNRQTNLKPKKRPACEPKPDTDKGRRLKYKNINLQRCPNQFRLYKEDQMGISTKFQRKLHPTVSFLFWRLVLTRIRSMMMIWTLTRRIIGGPSNTA
jgi:hypothetical protein